MTVATHGIALCLGWALWVGGGFVPAAGPKDAGMAAYPPQTRSRDHAGAVTAPDAEVQALLYSVRPPVEENDPGKQHRGRSGPGPEFFAKIDSASIPADFQEAFENLGERLKTPPLPPDFSADLAALAYHWLTGDPEGLFAYMTSGNDPQRLLSSMLRTLSPEIYRRDGIGKAMMVLSRMGPAASVGTASLGSAVGEKMDAAAIAAAKRTMDAGAWNAFAQSAGISWPAAGSEALRKLAIELDAPRLLLGIKSGEAGQGAFLAGIVADLSLPAGFRDSLRQSREYGYAVSSDPSLPLQTRLEVTNAAMLASHDIRQVFEKRDWAFAVRRGEATADEVLAAVTQEAPELVAKEPDLVRKFLFGELAEENPAAAMSLLKDEPESIRNDTALLAARTHFENIEPDKFLELMQQIPSDTPQAWEGRLDAWNLRAFTNNGRLHEAYLEWCEKLPAGLDRDMALYSLVRVLPDAPFADRLRAQVTDPKLQQRIATHQ